MTDEAAGEEFGCGGGALEVTDEGGGDRRVWCDHGLGMWSNGASFSASCTCVSISQGI